MSLSSILVPVDDMEAAIRFLSEQMEISPRFQDGDRYAVFPQMTVGVGLLGADERVAPEMSLGVRVADLDRVVKEWTAAGASTLRASEDGPHERRAVMRIPGGIIVTLSQKLPGA